MSYLLDTNVCIALMREADSNVIQRYRGAVVARHPIAISAIVLFELEYGVQKSSHTAKNRGRLDAFLRRNPDVLPLSPEDVAAAAMIRANLERQKQPIGAYDTLIAGQVLSRGLTLVTANAREFSRVDGLKWVDWSE